MKRNNVVKQIGIASLCLATAISAFSGLASFNKSIDFSGEAEDTTIAATDFVEASSTATVTRVTEGYSSLIGKTDETSTAHGGLVIGSNQAYSATFKRVFSGDATFNFRFAETSTDAFYGDFNFRITDVMDENNYFDITYYVESSTALATALYVNYKNEIRMCGAKSADTTKYNSKQSGLQNLKFAPALLGRGTRGSRMGKLQLTWTNGVLAVTSNTNQNQNGTTMKTIAKFDGTYNAAVAKNGFSSSSWGLPKISFPNGYKVTVSSDFTKDGVDDHGSDVLFYSIVNGATYNFNTTESFTKDNYRKAYDELSTWTAPVATGKALLGWKDAENALYPTTTALTSTDIAAYTPVYLGFDTINGASVRIETSEGGKSGIRFMTLFDVEDYAAARDYITSFGTIITYTDTLNTIKKDFTIENYTGEATFAQVKNNKGVFTYKDKNGNAYTAYSMALVDIKDYAKAYSARGYIEVTYADETTQIIYTDYNAVDNSRSIAQVAYNLKAQDQAAYEAMSDARKALLDTYAAAYVVPQA